MGSLFHISKSGDPAAIPGAVVPVPALRALWLGCACLQGLGGNPSGAFSWCAQQEWCEEGR